jgi:transcription termination/antitermination protein NusG
VGEGVLDQSNDSENSQEEADRTSVDPVLAGDSGAAGDPAPRAEFEAVEHTSATPESEPAPAADAANGSAADQPPRPKTKKMPAVESLEKPEIKRDWYILKVQSNREDSIRDGLQRRVAMAGLDDYFGDIIVPVEMVSEFKGGKKRVVKRKLYPGYIVVNMEINDDTWFLVRETPGIGDFTGTIGKPTPMLPHEVAKIVAKQEEKGDEAPKLKISFNKGDRVKINEGTFENFEGEVDVIDEANGRVQVMINIFGRSTPVELEYWQIEAI